jgi:hypothetical protein
MVDFWANWIEAVRFTCEAQGVISARLMLFASAAPNAAVEVERMISEKIVTFSAAQDAAERALAEGLGIYAAAERAYQPLRRCVRANSSRLGLRNTEISAIGRALPTPTPV